MLDVDIHQDADTFILIRNSAGVYLLRARIDDQWADQYEIDLWPQEWVDFEPANYFSSTYPTTIFTQSVIAACQTNAGRKVLVDDTFKVSSHGHTEQCKIDASEREALLAREFGLTIPR